MKKKTKIIISIVVTVFVIVAMASYFVPMLLLRAATKEILPECRRAEYITNFDVMPKDSIEVDNDGYTMQIPDYLTKSDLGDYDKANVYHMEDGEAKYIMLTEEFEEGMSLLDPEYYGDDETMKKYGIRDVEKMFSSLGYERPDSYYNIMKCACLLDWEDYNILSVRKSVAFSVFAVLRAEIYADIPVYLYERGDVRAIIQAGEEGGYHIDVFHEDNLNGGYGMMIKDEDLSFEEMTAMLNSVEFKK